MKDAEIKLREYIEKTMNDEKYQKEKRADWIFGAVDFALSANLIDWSTCAALADEYF